MSASLSGVFNLQSFTDLGALMAGGRLYTYAPSTTTQKTAYTDAAGSVAHTYTNDGLGGQYVALSSRGELPAPLFLTSGGYDITLKTSAGVTVWTRRAIGGDDAGVAAVALVRSDLASTSDAAKGSALLGVNQTLAYAAYTVGDLLANLPLLPTGPAFGAKFDGTTDDTTALNTCATAARATGRVMQMPRKGTAKVSASLDFSGVHVVGFGAGQQLHIQATSAQFDVITTTGVTRLDGLYVHGGWDGVTAGQSGHIVLVKATSPAYPYNVTINDCKFQYAKKDGVYWERGGYSRLISTKINACGLHAVEMFGNSGLDAATTVEISGMTTMSDTPNGLGLKITNGIAIKVDGAISEFTKGIGLFGTDNRNLSFNQFYQENTVGGLYLDFGASSGIGLRVTNCYGGGASINYPTTLIAWNDVGFGGNAFLGECAVPYEGRILMLDGGEFTTAAAGSFTAVTLSLPPGTWRVDGQMQTRNSAGGTVIQAGAVLTFNAADSGLQNGTAVGQFNQLADSKTYNPGTDADLRCNPRGIVQNKTSASVNLYLRAYVGRSAGTVAYHGYITAEKVA